MPNRGGRGKQGRGGGRKIAPNLSQRPVKSVNPLPSQYNFTPATSAPPQREIPTVPTPHRPTTSSQPHFRDFPPPQMLFQHTPVGTSSSVLQNQNRPLPPQQNQSPVSPLHNSQTHSNPSHEANNYDAEADGEADSEDDGEAVGEDDGEADFEDDGMLFVEPVLQDDLLQLLNSLLQVPGPEAFTIVLSPKPLPNTTWFGRDKGALTRKITKIFTNKFDGLYYSWKVVPRERQERYFIEFAKTHTWEPLIYGTVQLRFEEICQKRMKDMISTMRTFRL